MSSKVQGPRHLVMPDMQVTPDSPTHHIAMAARYAAVKRPDVIVQLGDWADMESLSSYDRGKRASEGRRYRADVEAVNKTLALFDSELRRYAPRSYRPRKLVTLGNHEDRINRAVEDQALLEGTVTVDDLKFRKYGWEVHPFLRPVVVSGVTYLHYCPLNSMGKVTANKHGAPSALAQGRRMMTNVVCGHAQGLDVAIIHTPTRTIRSVIAGSFYLHDVGYIPPVGSRYWKGLLILNDIRPTEGFDLCEVSLSYLERRFG